MSPTSDRQEERLEREWRRSTSSLERGGTEDAAMDMRSDLAPLLSDNEQEYTARAEMRRSLNDQKTTKQKAAHAGHGVAQAGEVVEGAGTASQAITRAANAIDRRDMLRSGAVAGGASAGTASQSITRAVTAANRIDMLRSGAQNIGQQVRSVPQNSGSVASVMPDDAGVSGMMSPVVGGTTNAVQRLYARALSATKRYGGEPTGGAIGKVVPDAVNEVVGTIKDLRLLFAGLASVVGAIPVLALFNVRFWFGNVAHLVPPLTKTTVAVLILITLLAIIAILFIASVVSILINPCPYADDLAPSWASWLGPLITAYCHIKT